MHQRVIPDITDHGSSSREQGAHGHHSAQSPIQELADTRLKAEHQVGSAVNFHHHRGYPPRMEDGYNVSGQQTPPSIRDHIPVVPEQQMIYMETAHNIEHQEGRRSGGRSRRNRERQEQPGSSEVENVTFQTLVKTIQGDLRNAVDRFDNLERQVKQLTSEKDIWLAEKSQIAKERAKEKDIRELDKTKRRRWQEQIQSLKEENVKFQTLVNETQGDLMNAVNRSGNLQRQVNQLTSEKDVWSAEKSKMISKEKDIRELEETKRRQEGEIQRLQETLRRSEDRNVQLERLLDVRTAELNSAQVFLTTADLHSGADILSMVEVLNAEIFQGAASMAELLEDDAMMAVSEEWDKNYLEFERRKNKPTAQLGNTLLDYLVSNREQLRADSLPLQVAFQAFLTSWCVHTTERLCEGDAGRDIQKVYQRIRDTEAQSIAGRWRAIAFGNSKTLASETRTGYVIETLLSLLGLCGWTQSSQKSQRAILSIQTIVANIAKLWGQLKKAIKEDVTTVDMQIFNYNPGAVYDAGLMEDAYGESGGLYPQPRRDVNSKPKDKILCTIGLGLKRSLVKHSEDGKPYERIDVSLKPKVALVSVLALAGPTLGDARPTTQHDSGG